MIEIKTRAALAVALALALAGCSGGELTEDARRIRKDQEAAADAVVTQSRAYLEAREKAPGRPGPKGAIAAHELALETLVEAEQALDVAERAAAVMEDYGSDRGRAARVSTTAGLLKRAAIVAAAQARETLRTGDDVPLRQDQQVLRALLRALRADIAALGRGGHHD